MISHPISLHRYPNLSEYEKFRATRSLLSTAAGAQAGESGSSVLGLQEQKSGAMPLAQWAYLQVHGQL